GETEKFEVRISLSGTPSFLIAAITDCMRLLLADSAAAAVGPSVLTPADSMAVSGVARTSPWPPMVITRGACAWAAAGGTHIIRTKRARAGPVQRRVRMANSPF